MNCREAERRVRIAKAACVLEAPCVGSLIGPATVLCFEKPALLDASRFAVFLLCTAGTCLPLAVIAGAAALSVATRRLCIVCAAGLVATVAAQAAAIRLLPGLSFYLSDAWTCVAVLTPAIVGVLGCLVGWWISKLAFFSRLTAAERILANQCPACGYSLQGVIGPRCPECGLALPSSGGPALPSPSPRCASSQD